MELETRAYYVPDGLQIRAVDGTEGIFEGYAIVWDTLDAHGTRFRKGCCTKTLNERASMIKILDNHNMDAAIGKPLLMEERDIGLFVRGQLTAGVQRADEMRLKIDAEVIDTLSIGFKTIMDKPVAGSTSMRDVTEIKLYEFSPVTFPSNEAAKITDFRSEDFVSPDNEPFDINGPGEAAAELRKLIQDHLAADHTTGSEDTDGTDPLETRDTDFDDTLTAEELYDRGWLLNDSLRYTLSDIWWSAMDNDEIIIAFDTAIAKYHIAYIKWAKEFMERFWEERHEAMANKEPGSIFNYELKEADETIESMALKTTFTVDELRALSNGELLSIESRGKMAELPEVIQQAHHDKRASTVEIFCNELRSTGFNEAEAAQFKALLGLNRAPASSEQRETRGMHTILNTLDTLGGSV